MPLRTILLALLALPAALVAQPVPCEDGFAGDYPCQNVDLLARLPLNATPAFGQSSSDIWGWTDPDTGTEYALINQYNYTAFVDLSDPATPLLVGTLPASEGTSVARDVKTYANHAFITTDTSPSWMQVFDLARLRTVAPDDMPVTFAADTLYLGTSGIHNLALDERSGFAYLVGSAPPGNGCNRGLHMVDVRDPVDPTFAGCYADLGYIHDTQCLVYDGPDADYAGREICFAAAPEQSTLAIVDVTDKAAPTLVSETPYPDAAYTHQGWLTEDSRYFLLDDEFDETTFGIPTRTLVLNVEDLDDPSFVFAYTGPTASTDHNLFVRNGYAFQANYKSGLRVLDLAGIDGGTLTEAAFFDTHPESDTTGFDGAFGVYPFFESGIVVVSDMARGLFVLQPSLGGTLGLGAVPRQSLTLTAYPNPFADRTTLTLATETSQHVTVSVYDVLGRAVAVLHEGPIRAGEVWTLVLEADTLPAGSYTVRAVGETFEASGQVMLIR